MKGRIPRSISRDVERFRGQDQRAIPRRDRQTLRQRRQPATRRDRSPTLARRFEGAQGFKTRWTKSTGLGRPAPAAMGVTDKGDPGKAYLLKRGDWRNKGEEVHPGLPQILAGDVSLDRKNRRRQLAEWIASADNPLTARVAVNRIWQYHFRKGIVKTPSDFGATGIARAILNCSTGLPPNLCIRHGMRATGRQGDGATGRIRNPRIPIRNQKVGVGRRCTG